MRPRFDWRSATVLVACILGCLASGGASATADAHLARLPAGQASWRLVGLGDSITAGQNCPACARFVDLYAHRITEDTSVPVSVTNLGVGGSTSEDLLASLSDGGGAASQVRAADVVTVTIGANDFFNHLDRAFSSGCDVAGDLHCFEPELATLRSNVTSILRRIAVLRDGRPTVVRVTGYWNVFLDGAVAVRAYGPDFARASNTFTRRVNDVLREVAEASRGQYVDLYRPFKGESGDDDDTSLLADDGDHPSQAGHDLIADSLALAGYAPLSAGT